MKAGDPMADSISWAVEAAIREGWTAELIRTEVERTIDECDDLFTAYDGPAPDLLIRRGDALTYSQMPIEPRADSLGRKSA